MVELSVSGFVAGFLLAAGVAVWCLLGLACVHDFMWGWYNITFVVAFGSAFRVV